MKELNGQKKTTSSTNEYETHPYEEGLNAVVENNKQQKNKLDVGLWKTSQN